MSEQKLRADLAAARTLAASAMEERDRAEQASRYNLDVAEQMEERAKIAEAKLTEGDYTDERGVTWTRASGWAFHQLEMAHQSACKERDQLKQQLAQAREALRRAGKVLAECAVDTAGTPTEGFFAEEARLCDAALAGGDHE